jgi:hypothetical protein
MEDKDFIESSFESPQRRGKLIISTTQKKDTAQQITITIICISF